MGVVKELQASRMASQLAFMMIEYIRRASVARYGATRGEIGWILDDNQGMRAIAETIGCRINKVYQIYEQARSEEHTSELQSLMRISYAVFCLNTQHISHS